MGGGVSTGVNNDDLIDNLVEADYIRTSIVENVFRAVDRSHYFLSEARENAYKDLAWKCGHFHMSAPCIYTEVMEGLCLDKGLSFLNLGSGTGYLSTLVGLVLGSNGVNHGIELHEDVVQYAYKRLDEFKKQSGAIDEFDFCEPKFVIGNCLCLSTSIKYDRVYCGAACPRQYENHIKDYLQIGGILVMPLNDQLLQIKRISETDYETKSLLPVSFATLIVPEKITMSELLWYEPQTLQSLCRAQVRNIIRKNIEAEFPDVLKRPRHTKKPKRKERALRRLNVPLFEDNDTSDDEPSLPIGSGIIVHVRRNSISPDLRVRRDRNDNPNVSSPSHGSNIFEVVVENPERSEVKTDSGNTTKETNPVAGSSTCNESKNHRVKCDSGLGEDIVIDKDQPMSPEYSDFDQIDSSSSSTDDNDTKRSKRLISKGPLESHTASKWRRINSYSSGSESDNMDEDENIVNANQEFRIMVPSPYTTHMVDKIMALPLPIILKKYLNYYRDF